MSNYEIVKADELYHYGRKGMKWGQHIFGKVKSGTTKAGRAIGSVASSTGRKMADGLRDKRARRKAEKLRAKPLSKLTDEELKERIKRLGLEKQAVDIMRQTSGADAKAVSTGKKILSRAATDIIAPTLVNVGKNWLQKALSKKLNLEDVDEGMKKLETEAKKAGLERTIAEAKAAVKKANNEGPLDYLAEASKRAEQKKKIIELEEAEMRIEKKRKEGSQTSDQDSDSSNSNSTTKKVESAIQESKDVDIDNMSESMFNKYLDMFNSLGDID